MAGDYIIIDDMGHRKKLKEYFVNQKIPAEQRNNMWLIAEDNEIIAILGDRSGNSAPVSYTHLDVYKRQVLAVPMTDSARML